jgi:hypothetical protein
MASWVSHQRLDNGDIRISWPDVQQLLGRPYRGDDEDDSRIVEFLRRDAGLPEWIEEAEGYQDPHGWYLKSPVQFDRAAFMAWLRKVAQTTLVPNAVADAASQLFAEAVDRGWPPRYELPRTFSRTGEVCVYEP